ncbi:MAG: gas vesicle protein GvpG [Pikeienuella sp.]
MLLRLLSLPVAAPISGALWLGRTIRDQAERELNDPARLRRELAALERALECGEIDEEAFEAREAELIARLMAKPRSAP